MSTFPLEQLLDVIDRLPIRYKRTSNIKILVPGLDIAQRFTGTDVPAVIDCSDVPRKHRSECVYQEWWQCCGEYGCTTGDKSMKKTSPAYHCKARMCVQVFATAQGGCVAKITEDDPSMHGSRYRAPEADERYTWRSKVIIAQAAAEGVQSISDLLSERNWDSERVPLPRTTKEKNSLRNRLAQLRRKLAKQAKEAESSSSSGGEEGEGEEEEEESSDEPEIERVLETKANAATGKRMQLVKWKHWPELSATWVEAPPSPIISDDDDDDDAATVVITAAEDANTLNLIMPFVERSALSLHHLTAAFEQGFTPHLHEGAVRTMCNAVISKRVESPLGFMMYDDGEGMWRSIAALRANSNQHVAAMYQRLYRAMEDVYGRLKPHVSDPRTEAIFVCFAIMRCEHAIMQFHRRKRQQ